MNKIVIGLLVLSSLLISYPLGKKLFSSEDITIETENKNVAEFKMPTTLNSSLVGDVPDKLYTVKNTLILESNNTVVLRGPVTSSSVSTLIKQMSDLSFKLSKTDKIYLVLDTPGGSIFDGIELIDFMEGLPQEVRTVTLFAASMGFQIAENNPGKRFIAKNGILMSHRASGGIDGQFDGELESRYKMVKRKIDYLDSFVSKRIGMTVENYKSKIVNEWWVHGFDAVDEKLADEIVLVQCGKSMVGTEQVKINTMFGVLKVTYETCPLIKTPVSIDMSLVQLNARDYIKSLVDDLTYNKTKFTKDIILTDKFNQIFQ